MDISEKIAAMLLISDAIDNGNLFELIYALSIFADESHLDDEEYSLGQEDRIVIIKDIANSEKLEEESK